MRQSLLQKVYKLLLLGGYYTTGTPLDNTQTSNMMMSNQTTENKEETAAAPAFSTPTPQLSSVADLERRLQILDTADQAPPAAPAPAPVAPPSELKPAPKPAAPSGKSALLVRVVAPTSDA